MAEYTYNKGQSLVEIMIAVAVGAILIGASTGAIVLIIRQNFDTKAVQISYSSASKLIEDVKSLAEADWHNIDGLLKGEAKKYYVSNSTRQIVSGAETFSVEGRQLSRYFFIEDARRDSGGAIVGSGGETDPSTLKITAVTDFGSGRGAREVQYLTRSKNSVFYQTDWSGGFNQEIFSTSASGVIVNNRFATSSENIDFASTTGAIQLRL